MERPIEHKLNQILNIKDDTEQLYAFYNLIHDTPFSDDKSVKRSVVLYEQSSILLKKHQVVVLDDGEEFKRIINAHKERLKILKDL